MGMIGNYVAISNDTLKEIRAGKYDIYDIDPDFSLDIDKSWQAIHYVLCGDIADGEPPMGYVVPMRDDNFLELEEMDYGAFLLTYDLLKEAYRYIEKIDKEQFLKKYNVKKLVEDEVYPLSEADLKDNGNDFFEYIFGYFEQIKTFFKKALENNQGVVFYID